MTFLKKKLATDTSVRSGCSGCSNDTNKKAKLNTRQYATAQNRCSNCPS